MRKLNFKNIIILILMFGALLGVISDAIYLMNGASYTWFGLITAFINIAILGVGVDHFRG